VSNALAIAAATATLRNLLLAEMPQLDPDLTDLEVTAQPLDLARKGVTKSQLNLFLYHTTPNSAWRNQDLPRQTRPGEVGVPPLALNLHYLVTAYGRGESDNDVVNHRVLGSAMSVLHDHPLLSRSEIALALSNNDLGQQFERVKITLLPLGVEDLSKVWMMSQTEYRISVAYEVTVVLIDSRSPASSALPVLRRGEADRGVFASAGSGPTLDSLRLPRSQPALRLSESGTLVGSGLTTKDAELRFATPRLVAPISVSPSAGTKPDELSFRIEDVPTDPDAVSRWVPGLYSVALLLSSPGVPAIVSNELPFALAPRISLSFVGAGPGAADVTIECVPRIAAGQRVLLLVGDRQFEAATNVNPGDPTQPTQLTFQVEGLAPGSYVARLRVDGVDSIPVVYSGTPPLPGFDPSQKVTVA
jgi:hypothetical protein